MATEGSALALHTPLPTPYGWTNVGDVKVGDTIFDQDGWPQVVTRETGVLTSLDCYAVSFSDGERIVASGSHPWTLERRTGKGTAFDRVTVTTEHLATDYIRGGANGGMTGLRYRLAAGVEFQTPEAELPVDPYLLGLWLGDGSKRDASIAYDSRLKNEYEQLLTPLLQPHEELVFHRGAGNGGVVRIGRRKGLCARGHRTHEDRYLGRTCGKCYRKEYEAEVSPTKTLRERLRQAGVLGHKHVPAAYMRASAAQRHALLQGLIDSDGSLALMGKSVQACFTNADRRLIEDAEELLTTLGYKWRERHERSVNAWRVIFVPCVTKPVARLSHKVERHQLLGDNARSRRRHVKRVERVKPVRVKCIGIDTGEHLFLVGHRAVPTHGASNKMRW